MNKNFLNKMGEEIIGLKDRIDRINIYKYIKNYKPSPHLDGLKKLTK